MIAEGEIRQIDLDKRELRFAVRMTNRESQLRMVYPPEADGHIRKAFAQRFCCLSYNRSSEYDGEITGVVNDPP